MMPKRSAEIARSARSFPQNALRLRRCLLAARFARDFAEQRLDEMPPVEPTACLSALRLSRSALYEILGNK